MFIKQSTFRKALLLVTAVHIACQGCSQGIEGVFSLEVNSQHYYINFKNNTYDLFSLQENPLPGAKTSLVLKDVGSGSFNKLKHNIALQFDNDIPEPHFYTSDSLVCSMYTKEKEDGKTFEISIKYNVPEYNNTFLIIEGYSKEYRYQIKDGKLKFKLPDSVGIKEVYISVMGYGKRLLLYNPYYNTFKYDYFLNDSYPQITYIQDKRWNLPIKSNTNNDYFKLDRTDYLVKADDKTVSFLKELADKDPQIKQLTSEWFKN